MKTNLSHLDRAIRLGGGLFLFASPILDLKTYPYNLYGIVLIATAVAGFSPLYALVRSVFSRKPELGAPRPTHGFGQLGGPRERHQPG
jgi:hypothetical protein